jgi:tetratricopeptide (TPR) repeat protein
MAVLLAVLAPCSTPIEGQEPPLQALPLQRSFPGPGPFECPAPVAFGEPTPDERERARQLTSDALQAIILGELDGARILLSQATAADGSSAEFAYRHGRVLEDLGLADAAILEYCRALSLGAVEAGISDSRARLDALYEVVRERISDRALAAFVSGLSQADIGYYPEAIGSFSVAIDESPQWPAAVYNRAIVLEQLGRFQESLADYRRYLELTPSEVDPVVASVSERIGMIEGELTRPTPNPTSALALGVLFPGMGQYYSGRGRAGTVVLSGAMAVVVAGLVVKEVTVRCLVPVNGGEDCPAGQVVDETTRRPYLWPALGLTGAVMIGSAIEAWVRARRARADQPEGGEPTAAGPFRLDGPSIEARGGRVDLKLLQLRFR